MAQAAREKQREERVSSRLKIVLLSGDYRPFNSVQKNNFDDILTKPLKLNELDLIIGKYIN